MPNPNYFISQQNELMIEDPINGQQATALYDPIKQAALVPDLRQGADGKPSITLPYADMGFEGFLSQLLAEVSGSAERKVKSREFYWAELDQWESMAFSIVGGAGTTPGNTVATTISRFSQSQNGLFVKPLAGYDAILKEDSRRVVRITAVTQVSAGTWNISIKGQNNRTIDLTSRDKWTLILMPMRSYEVGTTTDIATRGFVYNSPILYKSGLQKFEDGISIHQDEIDNFVYTRRWEMVKGLDRFGRKVDYMYMPAVTDQFSKNWAANRILRLLMNTKDFTVNEGGFDGIIPTIEKYGMFNMSYSTLLQESFRDLLFAMIKNIRKVNGSPTYMMLHDFGFGLDWSNAMNALVKAMDAGHMYKSFGDGAIGTRTLEYFKFTDFSYSNYRFMSHQIEMFDNYRVGNVLENFAMLLPGQKFKDSDGATVPIVTQVFLEGAEPAKERYMWFDNQRERGGRYLRGFIQDHFGLEIHAPTRCGIITKGDN